MQQGIRDGPAEDANECTTRLESILKQAATVHCTIPLTWTIFRHRANKNTRRGNGGRHAKRFGPDFDSGSGPESACTDPGPRAALTHGRNSVSEENSDFLTVERNKSTE